MTNLYRLASSITTFPFTDPSPTRSGSTLRLLGIRIDIIDPDSGSGRYGAPYYILTRRRRGYLSIYRHTIPSFIDLRGLEARFLPRPEPEAQDGDEDEERGDEEGKGVNEALKYPNKQDLHALVHHIRRALVSWTLRRASIRKLQEELGIPASSLSPPEDAPMSDASTEDSLSAEKANPQTAKYGVTALSATAYDAKYISVHWADGRVGRIKVAERAEHGNGDRDGRVECCVVYGKEGREKATERTLVGEGTEGRANVRVEDLARRLELLDQRG